MSCITTMRRALDEFCAARSIALDSPLAMNAAHYVIALSESDPTLAELRQRLDDWCSEQENVPGP